MTNSQSAAIHKFNDNLFVQRCEKWNNSLNQSWLIPLNSRESDMITEAWPVCINMKVYNFEKLRAEQSLQSSSWHSVIIPKVWLKIQLTFLNVLNIKDKIYIIKHGFKDCPANRKFVIGTSLKWESCMMQNLFKKDNLIRNSLYWLSIQSIASSRKFRNRKYFRIANNLTDW